MVGCFMLFLFHFNWLFVLCLRYFELHHMLWVIFYGVAGLWRLENKTGLLRFPGFKASDLLVNLDIAFNLNRLKKTLNPYYGFSFSFWSFFN